MTETDCNAAAPDTLVPQMMDELEEAENSSLLQQNPLSSRAQEILNHCRPGTMFLVVTGHEVRQNFVIVKMFNSWGNGQNMFAQWYF